MSYNRYTFFIVIFVFLVVLAGGIVRTTQSGMGCPDWPKCFGMWIPPINESQLPVDFEKYLSKQDIDHTFNVYHTWVEYINRLLGALLGLFIVIHLIWSVRMRNSLSLSVVSLSFLMFLLVGFTGWLGKVVVDNNLSVFKVTLHMLSALALAVLPLLILRNRNYFSLKRGEYPAVLLLLFGILLLLQLYLGTVVREEIDLVSKNLNYSVREEWISYLSDVFIFHRSFSWIILIFSCYLFWRSGFGRLEGILLALILILVIIGILFVYSAFPAYLQPIHLLVSLVLISISFSFIIPIKHDENGV
jgi:cytochrome c oxidase assembly protein subunit 15